MVTRISRTVVGSNVISADSIANNTLVARHISNSAIEARHLGSTANTSIVQANVDAVETRLTANIDVVSSNTSGIETRLNANLDIVQNNVDAIIDGVAFTGDVSIASSLGIDNTAPISTSITLGSPANVIINYSPVTNHGNVLIGQGDLGVGATAFSLDVRGGANVASLAVAGLTASRALQTNASKELESSSVTTTELGFVSGVSSAIQTQLDSKAALSGATFTGQVNMGDDLVITGNLVVNGDTVTANSVNLLVEDRIIMVSNSTTGTPSQDAGLFINRGNQGNAAFVYDESRTAFALYDTQDPHTNTAISFVTRGNLEIGTANVFGAANTGALTSTGVTVSGLTASRALQTNASKDLESSSVTSTELGRLSGVIGDVQTQLNNKDTSANVNSVQSNVNIVQDNVAAVDTRAAANVLVAAANDFATYTRLNANINVVQDNVAAFAGTTLSPGANTITSVSGANAYGIGSAVTVTARIRVAVAGVVQSPTTDFIIPSAGVMQLTEVDSNIPAGLPILINYWD